MGVTISYRGRLADLARIEDFEDRLLDFALEVGGLARIWRSHADDNPERMVRGVILDLAPGQEPVSMLIAPEGWLIGLVDIKDAEEGRLTEPPWCCTKTQFGPLEAHVALVEMLAALKREFLPDLEVSDEGGYWESRDLAELARRRSTVQQAIEGIAEGLKRHGLSREAAEDPEILLKRIERIAAQVQRTLQRPSEHPPVQFPEEDVTGTRPDPETVEALWDEMYKHNRRQQERMQRSIEDRLSQGDNVDSAFDHAIEDLGLGLPDEDSESEDEAWDDDVEDPFAESLQSDEADEAGNADTGADDDPFGVADEERHPVLKRATELLEKVHELFHGADTRSNPALHTLFEGAGDAMGGLAQALAPAEEDVDDYGLRVSQFKRALRGAAFARGALLSLRPALTPESYTELLDALGRLGRDIFQELCGVRAKYLKGDS